MSSFRCALFLALLPTAFACGCAANRVDSTVLSAQIERGRPHKFVDGVGWVLGAPEKLLLWDRRAENHKVSADTEMAVAGYLAANGNTTTKVRINQYAPGAEWRRLAANKNMSGGWRYTFGALRTLGYTVLPGRLIGNDGYNPYTDTISIYSDIPALAMEQAGHAKVIKRQSQPGTYASVFSLPVLALFPEKAAKDDVLQYIAWEGGPGAQMTGIRTLYPQYGTEVGGQLGDFVPGVQPVFTIAGAGIGHALGWYRNRGIERHEDELASAVRPLRKMVSDKALGPQVYDGGSVAPASATVPIGPAINPADAL